MAKFQEKIAELVGQEIMIRVSEGETLEGLLKEVGDDYLVMEVARGARRVFNLRNVSSIAEIPRAM